MLPACYHTTSNTIKKRWRGQKVRRLAYPSVPRFNVLNFCAVISKIVNINISIERDLERMTFGGQKYEISDFVSNSVCRIHAA